MCNAAGACVCGATDAVCVAGTITPQCLDVAGAEPQIEVVGNNPAATCQVGN